MTNTYSARSQPGPDQWPDPVDPWWRQLQPVAGAIAPPPRPRWSTAVAYTASMRPNGKRRDGLEQERVTLVNVGTEPETHAALQEQDTCVEE